MDFAAPTFNTRPEDSSTGDSLGLGAVTERLYGEAFAGINNAVLYVRPYAALCWMVYQLDIFEHGSGKATVGEIKAWRDRLDLGLGKIELLMMWSATIEGVQGLPGKSRFKEKPSRASLQMSDYRVKTRFLESAWYGPSLIDGLGLVYASSDSEKTYRCTEGGKALALAYDAQVRKLQPQHQKWLIDLRPEALSCTSRRVEALQSVLSLASPPSPGEREAFFEQFSTQSARRPSIRLALDALDVLEQQHLSTTVDDVRLAMAAGRTPDGSFLVEPSQTDEVRDEAQLRWSVLQLRLLHRLALEALLGVVERYLYATEVSPALPRTKDDVVVRISDCVHAPQTGTKAVPPLQSTVELTLEWLHRKQGGAPTLQAAGIGNPDGYLHLGHLKDRLRAGLSVGFGQKAQEGLTLTCRYALWALLYCAVEVDNLSSRRSAANLLGLDEGKLPLLELRNLVQRYRDKPLEMLTRQIIRQHVIDQHLYVATSRTAQAGDGHNRFVFRTEGANLERWNDGLSTDFLPLGEGGDVLHSVLRLLGDCGMVRYQVDNPARFNTRFRLTKAGREWCRTAGGYLGD
ncbi:TPA: hypothetical protein QDA71_005832 [Burkholderia vietnamiensis]|uniref:hypothetical protein n=1 Tax=Burkholderia vietnamiensis TaxID=60552 RepID=UPI00158EC0EC|nr:hypothetical protein [Burkholderia vietnamiensis]MCA8146117.1 hypothetical protein [Burkholderia vietnamiensis]HDR8948753.1 hypothetical protein [Burkholderia vietnamiensis]HDR9179290.1 hypothetical protein [Burkholderia vietnamiensis]HDR9210912.1 hypothetical protein [Burkholderia vietnamiensis]HDR9228790.1 hypothetical protein [Burkholderia vietnamiensis]